MASRFYDGNGDHKIRRFFGLTVESCELTSNHGNMLLGGKEAVELIVLLVPISAVSAFVCALKFQPAKRSNQEQEASGASCAIER